MLPNFFFRMIFSIITIFIVGMNYFVSLRHFKYFNGRILLTSIPVNSVDDRDIVNLTKEGRSKFTKFNIVFIFISIIIFPLLNDVLSTIAFLIILILYSGISMYLLNKYIVKMKKLKRDKNFPVLNRKYVDIKTAIEINKKQLSLLYWVIPILLFIIINLGIYFMVGKSDLIYVIVMFLLLLSFILVGVIFRRTPIKVVSENSDLNLHFNIQKKIKLQEKIFMFSIILVFVTSGSNYLLQINDFKYLQVIFVPLILAVLFSIYITFYMYSTHRELYGKYKDENLIYDDDDYYDIFGYKNPGDSRILIPDPVNSSRMVLNRGNKKGNIIFIFSNISIVILILFTIYSITPSKYNVEIGNETVKISARIYSDKIKKEDVESLKILDKFPDAKVIRTNGVGTTYQNYGNFKIEGIGNVRLYIFNEVDKIIEIKLKNGKLFYINQETQEDTMKLYENLTDTFK